MQIESSKLLSVSQKAIFARGRIATLAEVWLHAVSDIAKKSRVSVKEVQAALDLLCKETAPRSLRVVTDGGNSGENVGLTTGENALDSILGGGIAAHSITEIVGEAAAGKTQLALQLSAMSQIPIDQGGLDGAVAYITTGSASLQTKRLLQIARLHRKTAKLDTSSLMDNIHHCRAPTVYALMQVLNHNLPSLCDHLSCEERLPPRKPIRLLVIDSITSLFQIGEKTTTMSLVERSKALAELSTTLHRLASQRGLTVLVLSHVTDVFQAPGFDGQGAGESGEILYRDQSKWFSQGAGDGRKEATLGLSWANQVNTRVMLSRTERRRLLEDDESTAMTVKRRKGADGAPIPAQLAHPAGPRDEGAEGDEGDDDFSPRGMRIRRFSLVFSPSAAPAATDFVVVAAGVQALSPPPSPSPRPPCTVPAPTLLPTFVPGLTQLVRSRASQNTHIAPVGSSPRARQRAPSIDELSAFDEEEWIAIAEKSEIWDGPEPEVGELPFGGALNVDESNGCVEEFIPSSQGEEVELTSFDNPSNVVLPNALISSVQS